MQPTRLFAAIAGAIIILAAGCGGGGSSDPGGAAASAADLPPADGSYAGTYECASTQGASALNFTAVLPTATGAFTSCSGGGVNGTVTTTCTGSIASDGTFKVAGTDSHNNTLTFNGVATSSLATGTYTISPASVTGSFECTH